MLKNYVLNNFHSFGVSGRYQILICSTLAFVTNIYGRKIKSVIAVIIISAGVGYYGSYPYCTEAECLYIVQLFDKTFEVTSPCGVGVGVVCGRIVPAMYVVSRISVIEACCYYKIYCILSQIRCEWVELLGIFGIPYAVLVPVFAGTASCKLLGLLSVLYEQHIYFCNICK